MLIWNGYVQVSLMLYSLKIIKLHNWIINFVSPLETVPECPFQSAVLRALQLLPDLHIGFSRGRSGGLVFPSLSELSTVYCDPHSQRLWHKAEIDVFLELSCFFDDLADVGNLIPRSSAFSKTSLNIWKFIVHVLLKPGLENFEHYFTSV